MVKLANDPNQYAGDLYGELTLAESGSKAPGQPLLPGLAICVIASCAAAWLSEHYGMPIILMGLLLGLSLNFVASDQRTHRGLDFASRTFLRVGIVILGTQVTIAQITALGLLPFVGLALVMLLAFAGGMLGAKIAGQKPESGVLAGGATAICGASAALALYSVLGKEKLSQAQFALTLVGISVASALAMSFYPIIADLLHLTDRQAGFLIGASIHDVAQAIGGGYAFSDEGGSYATIVKLARVALLAPVVALVALAFAPAGGDDPGARLPIWRRLALPWFITAFLTTVVLNSMISLPEIATTWSLSLSKALLLLAVTATAMRSRMDLIMQMGWQAVMPVMGATLASLLAALAFTIFVM
ncbi:putative sulfate exporter family transporter [Sphingomonas lacunae]|uniref:Putative sulfate exporter family transporter n=1 Tax=Sphingomonas lacunae TaxID=2698828 RepID=A0A6M4ARS8_9SPHN|nr:putative sulfate exporter family transporter [Sphingomonas lacunae]QJQ31757.1 putative sulfate exporter family transporter [Sphingomonas lacunae]